MQKRSVTLLILFLLLLSICVFSVPPFTPTNDVGLISIFSSNNLIFKANTDFKIHFHVFNSTGHLLKNDTTTCLIHLYDTKGSHILEYNYNVPFDSDGFCWYLPVNDTLINLEGTYSILYNCNNSKEGGAHQEIFEITKNGYDYSTNLKYSVISFICFIFAFIVIMIFLTWFFVKPQWLKWCFIGSLGFVPLLFSTLMSNLLTTRNNFIALKSLQVLLTWIGWIVVICVFVVALLYFINWTKKASKKKYGGNN